MRITTLVLLLFCGFMGYAQAGKITNIEVLDTMSVQELKDLVKSNGFPSSVLNPKQDLAIFRISYMTEFHKGGLTEVSGALVLPIAPSGPQPMAVYHHGTSSTKTNSPSFGSAELGIGYLLGGSDYIACLPDYIGLGINTHNMHPYHHAYSQAHSSINLIRASRHFMDSIGYSQSDQLFLTGYSQGGHATIATLKYMQETYPTEFSVTASAPMSGAYEMAGAQTDMVGDTTPYSNPGYLPYMFLAFQDVYGNLYTDLSSIVKPPYDTLMPDLFYGMQTGLPYINSLSTPVPRDMVWDSVIENFYADTMHPFRVALRKNDLTRGWKPESPVKLIYCRGDDQVSYLNSVNAYAKWTAKGAQDLEIEDKGNFDHGGCVSLALLTAKFYFDSFKNASSLDPAIQTGRLSVYPNPAAEEVWFYNDAETKSSTLLLFDLQGRELRRFTLPLGEPLSRLDLQDIPSGMLILRDDRGTNIRLMKQ